ncbi:hypothetical protein D3C84_1234870 [compost metagenome]
MCYPLVLLFLVRLNAPEAIQVHVVDASSNPLTVHLDAQRHVEQNRWTLRASDGEHVGESMGRKTK